MKHECSICVRENNLRCKNMFTFTFWDRLFGKVNDCIEYQRIKKIEYNNNLRKNFERSKKWVKKD